MKIRHIVNFFGIVIWLLVVALISNWIGKQAYSWLPPQAAAESHLIDDLISFLVTLGAFIFLGVTGTLSYSITFHRAASEDLSDGPHIEGNIALEFIWTVIPIMLVLWIANYSYQIYNQMGIQGPQALVHLHNPLGIESAYAATGETPDEVPPASPLSENIHVLAQQWAWVFHYPEKHVTSTELHLPSDRRINLVLESADVLHGFYVPAFRLKQDIIPGHQINFQFTPIRPGEYRLTDSQYSGTYFATMEAKVIVESPSEYQKWLAKAATNKFTPAPNQAASEYAQTMHDPVKNGWVTVKPAAPPLVNYPG